MRMYFVGIDLGTGSTKAIAIDETGNTLASVNKHYPTISPQQGYSEQDPELIWQAFVYCLKKITADVGYPPNAISFSSAMHSLVPVNQNGEALMNAILWADGRSGDIAAKLRESDEGEEIYRHTGTAVYAMSPLCKLIWLRENQPQIFSATHKFISIKEYVWFKLFNVYEIDYSIASATGMFDILELRWYAKSLEKAGINASFLSAPVDTMHYRTGVTNEDIKSLFTHTTFVIGASDGCCANLGGDAIKPGVAALTIGTSGAVRISSNRPIYNYKAMTFNYLLRSKVFICGGAVNNGGAAVDWLIKNFLGLPETNEEAYNQLFSSIEKIKPGSDGLIFLPYLFAERAPVWDAKSSASFINISAMHRKEHFLHAALEGICFALYDVLKAVEQPEEPIQHIVISGGFIASATWVKMLADITGKRLVISQTDDASAIGAIYLAMEALGLDTPALPNNTGNVIVEPDMELHRFYDRLFDVYSKLYENIKASVHQLYDLNQL
ncbi:gluconokinase [Mucilaginibacter sp.]|uniref:gluconokinase n=1 Tax=Mucilaginibacter sp. TaxID=1882438 RepID=UPI000CC549DD|nr:gluconokinase [Mucilaginibacter sp.]PLW90700.1 MAG: gluconokinase [Mucilaginibacter sp.]PMP65561.1 MAG: gluconokinase [Mucilaginibacter sp.]HEK22329.1 gluconokinase [Bacteroidota bacterium]